MIEHVIAWGSAIRTFSFLGLNFLELIGLACTISFIFVQVGMWLEYLWNDVIARALGLNADLRKLGEWAVVTGASDGIGKAYSEEVITHDLAKLGINVVLISRTREKLESVAQEIEREHNVKTKVIPVDFTDGLHVYDTIAQELQGLEIGVLVNNVGMFYPYIDFFAEHEPKNSMNILHCNVIATTMMCHLVLPQMSERERGAIINIGSLSGTSPIPLLSVYAATKSYVDMFSQSLELEYRSKNIIVQSVVPGYVATKMGKIRQPSWTSPSPTDFAAKALKTVGIQRRTAVHFSHRLALRGTQFGSFFFWYPMSLLLVGLTKALREKSKTKKSRILGQNVTMN